MKKRGAKTEARKRGDLGERAAARYLKRRLYRVLERNWFFHQKEIDIIAKRRRTLVICEVKTRTYAGLENSVFGTPAAAVDAAKQKNLLAAARAYVHAVSWQGDVRFDVIEVYLLAREGKSPRIARIEHIQNAFTA